MPEPTEVQILAAALARTAGGSPQFRAHVIELIFAVQANPEERASYESHLADNPDHKAAVAALRTQIAAGAGPALSTLPEGIEINGQVDPFLTDVALSEIVHRQAWEQTLESSEDATAAMAKAIAEWRPPAP